MSLQTALTSFCSVMKAHRCGPGVQGSGSGFRYESFVLRRRRGSLKATKAGAQRERQCSHQRSQTLAGPETNTCAREMLTEVSNERDANCESLNACCWALLSAVMLLKAKFHASVLLGHLPCKETSGRKPFRNLLMFASQVQEFLES